MTMKKQLLLCICLLLSAVVHAQVTPQPITGVNVERYDSAWYADQAQAWLKVAQASPQDELAWKYFYMASSYKENYSENDSTSADTAMKLLEENIKGSYTYYYCKYRNERLKPEVPTSVSDGYIRKALELLPENKDFFDYDVLTYFCATHDNCPQLSALATEYYKSGILSPYILDFTRNELRGMPANTIYMGFVDSDLNPKWVLKYGNNEFTGVDCIYLGLLTNDSTYRKKVIADLGIKEDYPLPAEFETWEEYENGMLGLLRFLQEKTGRPIYFSSSNLDNRNPWYVHLWYEGLAYRFTEDDYDVAEVRRNNVEHIYDWKTAQRPVKEDSWYVSKALAAKYLYVLHNALYVYAKEGEKAKAKRYHDIAAAIGRGIADSDEELKELLYECDMLYDCAKNGIDPDFFDGIEDEE